MAFSWLKIWSSNIFFRKNNAPLISRRLHRRICHVHAARVCSVGGPFNRTPYACQRNRQTRRRGCRLRNRIIVNGIYDYLHSTNTQYFATWSVNLENGRIVFTFPVTSRTFVETKFAFSREDSRVIWIPRIDHIRQTDLVTRVELPKYNT